MLFYVCVLNFWFYSTLFGGHTWITLACFVGDSRRIAGNLFLAIAFRGSGSCSVDLVPDQFEQESDSARTDSTLRRSTNALLAGYIGHFWMFDIDFLLPWHLQFDHTALALNSTCDVNLWICWIAKTFSCIAKTPNRLKQILAFSVCFIFMCKAGHRIDSPHMWTELRSHQPKYHQSMLIARDQIISNLFINFGSILVWCD